jgi:hypothetical protein
VSSFRIGQARFRAFQHSNTYQHPPPVGGVVGVVGVVVVVVAAGLIYALSIFSIWFMSGEDGARTGAK